MKKTKKGYQLRCNQNCSDVIVISGSIHNVGGVYLGSSRGVSVTKEDTKLLIEALVRLTDTGSIHPPEKTEVEELKEKVAELEAQLRDVRNAVFPEDE